ncbi:ion transporter [Dyella soli]|uniref:Ion transporter n=1 Tax=Dyella soli TaxID=522319 RepID=A0A4R0YLX6_9GAMM|nr:ion transporter [Dyella soli]TCI06623.1 ion transporter [Dyella soli]
MSVQKRFPSDSAIEPATPDGWRARWFHVIFRHDTAPGRLFDLVLMVAILLSILVAVLDTVEDLHAPLGSVFYALEWLFTIAFTLEYVVRLLVISHPRRYALSFYGIVDLMAVLPTYLTLLAAGGPHLMVIRALRILRVFRVLKMTRYVGEADMLWTTFLRARPKILVFFSTILTLVLIFGSLMYLIEGPENGYANIPLSMYWAVVTMTTVGFGDITPHTTLGRIVTSLIMLLGYSIIAVPTGIFAAELATGIRKAQQQTCPHCQLPDHQPDARYCRGCGAPLQQGGSDEETPAP